MNQLIIALLLLALPASLFAQSITVSGSIRAERTGVPLPGTEVHLYSSSWSLLDTLSTDAFGSWSATFPVSSAEPPNSVPASFILGQNYPNPFNPSTRIPFTLHTTATVDITVHNILGQELGHRALHLAPGTYSIDWTTKGSAGVLFYTVEIDRIRQTRKMIQLDGGGAGGLGSVVIGSFAAESRSTSAISVDSIRVVFERHLYEPDKISLAFVDGTHVEHALALIHDRAFVIDLHNDVLEQIVATNYAYQIGVRNTTKHTDIPRLLDGGLDAQAFSVWITTGAGNYYANTLRYLDTLEAQVQRNSSQIALTTTADSVDLINRQGRIAGILLMEGGECIENDLGKLAALYARGMRIMTITWNNRTGVPWATAHDHPDASTQGLTDFGRSVIRAMDSLGIIIDVSHVGPKTIDDILAVTTNPIIATHSNARAIRNHTRNLTDAQIVAIAERGGLVGINFYPPFVVSSGTATIESVIQHIDHIRNLVGADHIALGSDFDGFSSSPPIGLSDVSTFPALTAALLDRGYTREEIRKFLGENFLRIFRTVCR